MKAKTIVSLFSLILIYKVGLGQTGRSILKDTSSIAQTEDFIRTANNLKSGNWQDVSVSFFQLAFTDLTSPNKSLNFKTNLFSIKAKADSNLLIDKNYIKHTFDRNFQFNLGIKLDSNYNLKGFSTGFTWAIINKRDASIIKFKDSYHKVFFKSTSRLMELFKDSLKKTAIGTALFLKTQKALDTMLDNGTFIIQNFPIEFQQFYKKDTLNTVKSEFDVADKSFNAELEKVALQPLLTFSANGVFDNKVGRFNSAIGEVTYLKGLTVNSDGSGLELDLRARFTLTDTTLNTLNTYRNIINTTAGGNIVFAKSHKSYFEIKPYFQYQNIRSGLIVNEKRENVFFNAELRLRVTDTIWVPFTLKYDFKNANLLGFLNISLNLDAFKSSNK